MPLDPSIILAGRPAPIENPIQAYSQMLSMRAMQQQSAIQQQQAAQQAALYPYQQQQQQAAAQEAQIRVQMAQRAQQDQQALADAIRRQAQPSAAPDQTAAAPAYGYGPDNPVGPASPATEAPPPAVQAAGAPAYGSHPIDLMKAADDAFNSGRLSYAGYVASQNQVLAHRQELAKTSDVELKATNARHDEYLGRLAAFRRESPEYQQDNWKSFNQQAYTDGLLNSSEYSATISQHPELPDAQTLDAYQLGMQTLSGQQAAALKLQQTNAAQARQRAAEAQEKLRAAQLGGTQAKADQEARANWGGQLAAQTTQEGFDAVINRMPEDVARQVNLLTDGEFDPDKTPGIIQRWSQTPEQQVTSAATAAQRAQTAEHERTMEAQGWQRIALQKARAGTGGLTPIQTLRETDAISKEEFGLYSERNDIRSKLSGGVMLDKNQNPLLDKNQKPVALSPQLRGQMQSQLQLVEAQLQQRQLRKAQLMGIQAPPQPAINAMPEGEPWKSPDNHVWKKQDGIVYFVR